MFTGAEEQLNEAFVQCAVGLGLYRVSDPTLMELADNGGKNLLSSLPKVSQVFPSGYLLTELTISITADIAVMI